MTLADALAWWYARIDYERRAPLPGDLKLETMRALLRRLGDPQSRLRLIHVAGSKGKGSTSALLGSILQAAGWRVGLFTSPHLCRVEERIQVDAQPISGAELAAVLTDVASQSTGLNPTFFEVGTAAGFLHFLRRRVDIAIIEVGLGGRFDSTNVVLPKMALITSISFDHMKILGDRLEQIAFEKAGIIKPGRPVISGALAPEAQPVIARVAAERGASLTEIDRDFFFQYDPGPAGECRPTVTVRTRSRQWPTLPLGLLGAHQAANAAVVIAAIEELQRQGIAVTDQAVAHGLAQVRWPARLEVLSRRPWVVLDCAHNVASIQAMIDTLRESIPATRKLLLFGASTDKDVRGMLERLAPEFDAFFLTRYTKNPRAAAPSDLADHLRALRVTVPCHTFDDPVAAWQAARSVANPGDLIAITGSVFLAGELRPALTSTPME